MGVRSGIAVAAVGASAALFATGCGSSARPDARDEAGGSPPSEITATCTPGTGIAVSTSVVGASADGVHVKVVDNSGRSDTYLAYGWNGQYVGGDGAKYQLPLTLAAPPGGDLQLSCSPSARDEGADMTLVHVVDPHDFWSPPERPQDAGCEVDGVFYPRPPSKGPTEHAALEAMEAESWVDAAVTFEVHRLVGGYPESTNGGYRFVERRDGFTTTMGWVGRDDGVWSAQIDASCAERLGPAFDPIAGRTNQQDTLQVTCTAKGSSVREAQVRASPDGVQVKVDDRTDSDGSALVYGQDGDIIGGDPVDYPSLSPLILSPGQWQIGCSPAVGDLPPEPATVTVTDPDRDWRPRTWDSDCHPTGAFYAEGGHGPTEQEALADLVRRHPADEPADPRIRLYDDGYWRTPGHTFVVLDDHAPGQEHLYGVTYPTNEGGWAASLDGTCRPT